MTATQANRLSKGPLTRDARRYHQDTALTRCVRREEFGYIVVVKRQPGSAAPERIGAQVHLTPDYSSFHLDRAITTVSVGVQHGLQIRHKEECYAGVTAQVLSKRQIGCLFAEVPGLE